MNWVTQNRWYLVAVGILLPVALVIALDAGWFRYVESRDGRPVAIATAGETVEYRGAQWSLLESYSVDAASDRGQAVGLRPGTSLVSATIGVRPGAEPPACTFELTDSTGARTWDEADAADADVTTGDDVESYCSTDATEPYRVQVFFVVPDDAVRDARLRVYDLTVYPELILFEL